MIGSLAEAGRRLGDCCFRFPRFSLAVVLAVTETHVGDVDSELLDSNRLLVLVLKGLDLCFDKTNSAERYRQDYRTRWELPLFMPPATGTPSPYTPLA